MELKDETKKMQKRNMKLFPIYKMLAWDYLFFYTIDFLFLTQIKNISAADVVLKTTFYSFFGIVLQVPANIVVEFLGRKNSLILGNILNCLYIIILMLSRNLADLIFAEFFSASAFAIKNIVETTLLSESIPNSKYKSTIFSSINGRGASGYYMLNAISKIVAGILFQINGYLPMIICLIVLGISVILSILFIEPVENKKSHQKIDLGGKEIKEIRTGFKFVLKSERLKALIVAYSLISSLLSILSNYSVSLLEDVGISSIVIGLIFAVISLLSSYASKNELRFHKTYRNKSIIIIAFMISISCLTAAASSFGADKTILLMIIMIASFFIYGYANGMYYTIRDKYLGNFANKKINTKIYAVSELSNNISKVLGGLIASFLLDRMKTSYCMIIIGIMFSFIFVLLEKYMKTRVGLRPEQYSKEERKYDELKQIEKI